MKLILKITFKDDTKKEYECVDFASVNSDFVVLYKEDFMREYIATSGIAGIEQYFV